MVWCSDEQKATGTVVLTELQTCTDTHPEPTKVRGCVEKFCSIFNFFLGWFLGLKIQFAENFTSESTSPRRVSLAGNENVYHIAPGYRNCAALLTTMYTVYTCKWWQGLKRILTAVATGTWTQNQRSQLALHSNASCNLAEQRVLRV